MFIFLITIFPGIISAYIYYRLFPNSSFKKTLLYALCNTVCINLLIYFLSYMTGIRNIHLPDMSSSFKFKWLVLGTCLAVIGTWFLRCLHALSLDAALHTLKRLIPITVFFVTTYAIFMPSSLFLENINDFSLQYIKIIPSLLAMSAIIILAVNLVGFCLTDKLKPFFSAYIALLFAFALGLYVQGNFLNPKLPSLDGTAIDWSLYSTNGIISTAFWILCIAIVLGSSFIWKEKFEHIIKYASYFLSAVQLLSLIMLLFTNRLDSTAYYGFSKDGEFSIGSDKNIIIFIVDTLQADTMTQYLASDKYDGSALDNFTFFDSAVSGGAPTQLALPVLLTGIEYDPMQSEDEYRKEIWEETSLYDDLHTSDYDVRFYSDANVFSGLSDGIVDNYTITGSNRIADYTGFTRQLYKLATFYTVPQFLKDHYLISTSSITDYIYKSDSSYKIDDIQFFEDFKASAYSLTQNYENTFRLYHFSGVHAPYNINENLQKVEENSVTEQQQLQGVMSEIYAYLDAMKAADVYDTSTIIITGDHGRHESGNPETNPAVLIKYPQEKHKLSCNSAPIHFRNVFAALAENILDDYSSYGPSVYDITDDSDVERLHTINNSVRRRLLLPEDVSEAAYYRLIVSHNIVDNVAYQIWNPYEINHIQYQLGTEIDFSQDNYYTQQLNYRLYKENSSAIASNELSICFSLEDYISGDLLFNFIYSNVYNDSQTIRLYANGHKIENYTCTSDQAGAKASIVIPSSYIDGETLILRLVFPNAVTPNQLDRANDDTRVLSLAFDSISLTSP